MQMKKTWVVVGDEAIVRFLEKPEEGGDLVAVEELTDPDAHARESQMRHGPHGRRAGGPNGGGGGPTVSAGDSERHQHAQVFATRVAERLAQHHRDRRFEAVHLIAAPRFLGCLRKAIDGNVAQAIASTLDKDLVQESHAELTKRVFGIPAGRSA